VKNKYLVLIFALLFSILNSQAQCSIERSKESDGTSVQQAKFETLYKNVGKDNDGDYSLGFVHVMGRLFTRSGSQSLSKNWGLQVGVGGKPSTQVIVPRRVIFGFTDGSSIALGATDYQEMEGGMQLCQFALTDEERLALKKPIKTVIIMDNRTIQGYTSEKKYGLYDRVLSEQIDCLETR
jgi:hypothetical protein